MSPSIPNDPAAVAPRHFLWRFAEGVGTITLNRPERKNPLTFDSYRELTELFDALGEMPAVRAVVLTGSGENFCSGGDVHEIIGPLVEAKRARDFDALLKFTRMTGGLVRAMRHSPQPIVAAIDGVCAGAGAILAMASDLRMGTTRSKVAFLFARVGLSGADMGACAMLPRLIGQGRAAELLYTGRFMTAYEAHTWGFYNWTVEPASLGAEAARVAKELAQGPTFAHRTTKASLHHEWSTSIDDALAHEAQVQAECMMTDDFERAYRAFVSKTPLTFEGT